MTLEAAMILIAGTLWLVGMVLAELDYTEKMDELREIDRRVWEALTKETQ